MQGVARMLALLGGAVLLGLIALTCVSILGRQANGFLNSAFAQQFVPELAVGLLALGIGPVSGDYELVELGMGIAIFCFLPYCHLTLGHARVDLFLSNANGTSARLLRAATEGLFTLALVMIAWRLGVGTQGRMTSGQTSYLLHVPLWLPYMAAVLAASFAALSSATLLVVRLAEVIAQRDLTPDSPESST